MKTFPSNSSDPPLSSIFPSHWVVLVEVLVVVVTVLVEVVVVMVAIVVLEDDPSVFNIKHSQHLSGPAPHNWSIGSISISIYVRSSWRTSIQAPDPLNAARQ